MKNKPLVPALILLLMVLLLDQSTKFLIDLYIPKMSWLTPFFPYGGVGIFKDFLGIQFAIVHEINYGAAWGFFSDYAYYLFIFRILFILALMAYLIFCPKSRLYMWPLTLIIAGAIGNVLDVAWYGYVIDMFYFKFGSYSYPVFNVADSFIFIGVFWLIFQSLFNKKRA